MDYNNSGEYSVNVARKKLMMDDIYEELGNEIKTDY
jgi:hypothetical protein